MKTIIKGIREPIAKPRTEGNARAYKFSVVVYAETFTNAVEFLEDNYLAEGLLSEYEHKLAVGDITCEDVSE